MHVWGWPVRLEDERESSNVEDRRGARGVGGTGRRIGIGTVAIALIAMLMGADPSTDFKTWTLRLRKGSRWSDGAPFTGLEAWRQLYTKRGDQLAGGFAEQFLTYATGASIRFSEKPAVSGIVATTAESGHGLRSIIRASISSSIFLQK